MIDFSRSRLYESIRCVLIRIYRAAFGAMPCLLIQTAARSNCIGWFGARTRGGIQILERWWGEISLHKIHNRSWFHGWRERASEEMIGQRSWTKVLICSHLLLLGKKGLIHNYKITLIISVFFFSVSRDALSILQWIFTYTHSGHRLLLFQGLIRGHAENVMLYCCCFTWTKVVLSPYIEWVGENCARRVAMDEFGAYAAFGRVFLHSLILDKHRAYLI